MTQQIDMEWKWRWELLGGHVHLDLFGRKLGSSTWQNHGHLVLGAESFVAFQLIMPGIAWERRESEG